MRVPYRFFDNMVDIIFKNDIYIDISFVTLSLTLS